MGRDHLVKLKDIQIEDEDDHYSETTIEDVLAVLGETRVRRAYVSITPAQLRALRATPVTLVAAPGAGKALVFHYAKIQLDYGTIAHNAPTNAGDDIGIRYTGGAGQLVATQEATGLVSSGTDAYRILRAGSAAVNSAQDVIPVANAPLVAHNVGAAEYAGTGDSPLKFAVFYSIVTLDESA